MFSETTLEEAPAKSGAFGLSRQQQQILNYLTKFKDYESIASALNLTPRAVASTVFRIREKYRKAKRLTNLYERTYSKAKNRRYLTL